MLKRIKYKILNYLVSNLLKAPKLEDIILIKGVSVFLGNKQASDNELRQLTGEAKALLGMKIWHIFQATLKDTAHKIMFEKSGSFDDMVSGKWCLYNLDVQEQIVKKLSELENKTNML